MELALDSNLSEQKAVLHASKIIYRLEVRFFISLLLSLFIYIIAASIASGWALLMSVSLFVTCILSLVLPAIVLQCLSVELSGTDVISAGDPLPLVLKIYAAKWLKPLLRCFIVQAELQASELYEAMEAEKIYLDSIEAAHSISLKCPALKRGIRRLPAILIETSFPFGLVWCKAIFQSEEKISVLPKTVDIEGRFLYKLRSSSYVPGDAQGSNTGFQSCYARGVRAYNRSDSRRHIHWALSARHGSLMVREFEREGIPAFDLAFDNGAEWPDEAKYELAITAAASLLELGHSLGVHPELLVVEQALAAGDAMPGRSLDIDQQLLKLAALDYSKRSEKKGSSDPEAFAGRQNALILVTAVGDISKATTADESHTRSSVYVIDEFRLTSREEFEECL